jgi:ABC-type glycerol-3-phosphate transport system substrate-binding protein
MRRFVLILALLSLLLAGCETLPPLLRPATPVPPPEGGERPAADATATPEAEAPAPQASEEPPADLPEEPGEIVLTVWTAEAFAPLSDTPGGQTLLEQLSAFEQAYPDIRVEVYIKRTHGEGSTLAYLRSAPDVAPGILPDIALLDREGLTQAAREEWIAPVEPLLDSSIRSDLYPVAEALGSVDGTLFGLPYLLEVQHSIYRETDFEAPPNSFEAVLGSPVSYAFSAGALRGVNHTILLQYLAAGGTLTGEEGLPLLDAEALRSVLSFYAEARQDGVIDPVLFQLTDPVEAWEMYLNRQANLVTVTSTLYLAGRDDVRNTGLTWVPTLDGEPYALVSGWSWVMVTRDAERQAAAMTLVNFLMDPASQGEYTQAVHWLPSQRAALAVWGDTDPYTTFGDTLLKNADPLPNMAALTAVGDAVQGAFEDVLLNGTLPVQAANQAAQSVNPPEVETP